MWERRTRARPHPPSTRSGGAGAGTARLQSSGSAVMSRPRFVGCVSSLGPRQDGGPVVRRAHTEARCDGEGEVSGRGAAPRARRLQWVLLFSLRAVPLRRPRAVARLGATRPCPALRLPIGLGVAVRGGGGRRSGPGRARSHLSRVRSAARWVGRCEGCRRSCAH